MRYDDWDVILFPRDSHVPIQEFKTACYSSPDSSGRQSPTLTCYISSLPPSTPFRISVHSWATTARPSASIESRRKANQKIMYMVQVMVDGARVFRGLFEVASKWPQEIVHEKRTLTSTEHATSQRKPCLAFPPFLQHTVMQTAWNSRDPSGRINIMLSEQLICKTSSPGDLDLVFAHDLVCFSFQHAPKDILEQAGVSWPIRNPLYLPNAHEVLSTSSKSTESSSRAAKSRDATLEIHMQSPLSHVSTSAFPRPHNPEPLQRPNSLPPPLSHFPKPSFRIRGNGHTDVWDESLGSFRDNRDDINMDSWSTHRSTSNSNHNLFMGEYDFPASHSTKLRPPWTNTSYDHLQNADIGRRDERSRTEKNRQVMATLRDDQFGQFVEAMSPPERHRDLQRSVGSSQQKDHRGRPPTAHAYYPPNVGRVSLNGRPSAAALARKSSYPDVTALLRVASSKPSPEKPNALDFPKNISTSTYRPSVSSSKENCPPSQSRLPTPLPYGNRVPTPNPFVPRLPQWDSDFIIRDGSSVFSSFNRPTGSGAPPLGMHGNHGAAHTPSTIGGIRSRKEGLAQRSPNLSEHEVRHDQSLLPPMSADRTTAQKPKAREHTTMPCSTPSMPPKGAPTIVEIIDVDAIDPTLDNDPPLDITKPSPFRPNHKSGMSSMDSTRRLEQQLFSALGEELGSFDAHISNTDMGPEFAQALRGVTAPSELSGNMPLDPSAAEFEPAGKRKRQGTLVGEQDQSPMSKREKGGQAGVQEIENVPRTMGD